MAWFKRKTIPQNVDARAKELLAIAQQNSNLEEHLDAIEEYLDLQSKCTNSDYTIERAYDIIGNKCVESICERAPDQLVMRIYPGTNRIIIPTQAFNLDALVTSSLCHYAEFSSGKIDLSKIEQKVKQKCSQARDNLQNQYRGMLLDLAAQAWKGQENLNFSFDRLLSDYERNMEAYVKLFSGEIPKFSKEFPVAEGYTSTRTVYFAALNHTINTLQKANETAEMMRAPTGKIDIGNLILTASNAFERQINLVQRYNHYTADFSAEERALIQSDLSEALRLRETYLPKAKEIVEEIHDQIYFAVEEKVEVQDKVKALSKLLQFSLSFSHALDLNSLDSMIEYGNLMLQRIGGKVYWANDAQPSTKLILCAEHENIRYNLGIERSKNLPPTDKEEWDLFLRSPIDR